ncbi:hypothetical protein [Natronoglycomyces albus]|uniref:Uncharacterized protein n=1 Tax=Natronoglycomyces albus TaxID=2811108 RepID=A0A895XRL1_9ACTN|nr:hypothetical protein [Natronoglycomyces albus]QSB05196.1 hypothetical protein JQS30_15790 [Natronoglycomyces albus]
MTDDSAPSADIAHMDLPSWVRESYSNDDVYLFDEAPSVISVYEDPFLLEKFTFLVHVPAEILHSQERLRRFLGRARAHFGSELPFLLRLEADHKAPAGDGVRCNERFVEMPTVSVRASVDGLPADVHVEQLHADNTKDFVNLLLHGLEFSASSKGVPFRTDAVEANLRSNVIPAYEADQAHALLAKRGHEVIGFVSWVDTGETVELIDIWAYERDELRRLVSPLLYLAVAHSAAATVRGSIVGSDDNATAVFQRLLAQGWRLHESYWRLEL